MPVALEKPLIGTPNQVEWAVQTESRANAEFNRAAKALELAAKKRPEQDRPDIQVAILNLYNKRSEAIERVEAGYFHT